MNYLTIIKEFIIENFLFGDGESLMNDTPFFENGIIDSTGVLELITFLEEKFNMKVKDGELIPENFDSLNKVVDFLEGKLETEQSQVA